MRQIILDTETTGLRPEDGHRIIEIGCLEMMNRRLTGEHYHIYINPEREIEAGAIAVHGISNQFLKDKPLFRTIAKELMDFISGAELIIHNAPFDVGFINYELQLLKQGFKDLTAYCSILDTLPLARKIHVGQRNSLDALCKRYKVDNSKRDLHGALIDANLLAQVYLAMTGGQGSFFDLEEKKQTQEEIDQKKIENLANKHHLVVLKANADEIIDHKKYLEKLKTQGKCVWEEV